MDIPNADVSDYQREADESSALRAAADNRRRRNGAFIVGAAVVIGALAAALIVVWRGDDDEPVAPRTVATPTTTFSVVSPTVPISTIGLTRTELARATLSSGEVVRFEEVPGTNVSWCLVRDVGRQESSSCFGLGPTRPTVSAPQFFGPPAGPGFFTFVLPGGIATGVTVRDTDGALVPSARSSDGTVLLVLDPAGRISGPPAAHPARIFDLVARDGSVVARVATPGYPGTTGGPTGDPRTATLTCFRAQGVALPDSNTGQPAAGTTMRYAPEVALRVWQSCRETYMKTVPSSIPSADQMARLDCMAAQGWLFAVSSGPPSDPEAFNAAMTACSSQLPSHKALVACLQSRGLQVSEPPAQPFPSDAANLAWQNCRSEWTQGSGAPPQVLSRYDCMARHGWILALITGQPADETGYNAASRNCQ
jgi:hypothetical protein